MLNSNRLCHIVHGPHDEAFHNLWNQLRNEHEQLVRKGYTGEGFLSTGHKLGGARIPMQEARRRARAAAERRRTLATGSGQKLGGAPVRRGEDIRKVIADAATRRRTVTKGCASGTEREQGIVEETTKNGFRTKAEEQDANEEAVMQAYIEMIQEDERQKYGKDYVPPSSTNPAGSQGKVIPTMAATEAPPAQVDSRPLPVEGSLSAETSDGWPCGVCTLFNPSTYLCCDACGTERPASTFSSNLPYPASRQASVRSSKPPKNTTSKSVSSIAALQAAESKKPLGWLCHTCGTFMESQWWTCSSCGSMKLSS